MEAANILLTTSYLKAKSLNKKLQPQMTQMFTDRFLATDFICVNLCNLWQEQKVDLQNKKLELFPVGTTH